jgi:hypothetical protein
MHLRKRWLLRSHGKLTGANRSGSAKSQWP